MSRCLTCCVLAVCSYLAVCSTLSAAGYPAVGPGPVPNEQIRLTFDGKPGPFVPSRVGQTVEVAAWFLGRRIPIDRLKFTFPRHWAVITENKGGRTGTLRVLRMDEAKRELSDEEFEYEILVELKMRIAARTRRPAKLTLEAPFRFHRLQSTITLPSGRNKPFDLLKHPDIHPVTKDDVFVWPPWPKTEVIIWREAVWVGFNTQEIIYKEGVPHGIKPAGVILIAVRLRLRDGGKERWLYTNIMPTTLMHQGWDDENSTVRLPVFAGSHKVYSQAAEWFKSMNVPFRGLDDYTHVRGDLSGR